MSLEKLRTEVRREQIAQAVLALVADRGLRGLSMGGLARRVGLVPSAIYRHFRSKEEALDAALDLIGERLLGNVAAVRGLSSDSLGRLRELLRRHVTLIRENGAIPRVVFSDAVFHGPSRRRGRVWKMIRSYLASVAAMVEEGQEEGAIRADLDPHTASVMFLGLIQPSAILWALSDGSFDIMRQADESWALFRAVIVPPSRPSGR